MTTSVRIRPALPEDDAALADITERSYQHGGYLLGPLDPYIQRLRDVRMRREQATLLVAEIAGVPVGSVTVADDDSALGEFARPGEQEIRMLAVDPVAAGQGAGAALLQAAMEYARSEGAQRIVLHTLAEMRVAHRMYERVGFVREPHLDGSPEPGVWLLAYGLALT